MNKLAQEAIDKAYQAAIGEMYKSMITAYTTITNVNERKEVLGRVNKGIAIATEAKADIEKLI